MQTTVITQNGLARLSKELERLRGQTLAAIQGQTTADNVTFGGTCAAATVQYPGTASASATVDISDYCSG